MPFPLWKTNEQLTDLMFFYFGLAVLSNEDKKKIQDYYEEKEQRRLEGVTDEEAATKEKSFWRNLLHRRKK